MTATIEGLDDAGGPKRRRKRKPESITEVVPDAPLRSQMWADVRRVFAALLLGCGFAGLGDYIVTLFVGPEGLTLATALRLALLTISLYTLAFVVLAVGMSAAAIAVRVALVASSIKRARRLRGPFGPARAYDRPRPLAAWAWGGLLGGVVFVGASTVLARWFMLSFKEQTLAAMLLSVTEILVAGLSFGLAYVVASLAARVGGRLHSILGRFNPFGHPTAALVTIGGLFAGGISVLVQALPQLAPLIPWRHLLSASLVVMGAHAATHVFRIRGGLLPQSGRRRLIAFSSFGFLAALVLPVTLIKVGADPITKSLAVSSSPPMRTVIDGLRLATDFDRDGFGTLLGENDCAPFDPKIHRLARDLPDNGIDENCDGRDFVLGRLPSYRSGERMPVPGAFLQDWNVLLLTVDTVRYDHTNMDGYHERLGRNTTPELAKLAETAANFTFANAPSAGTMASIPAILTSKFFHSGIALDESNRKRGMPPKLKEQNLLISELFANAGYDTGTFLTHEYFNEFGMRQGFATYDNSLGAKPNPFAVTSETLTDKGLAWIGQRTDKRWFLWMHYIDPHGRYVAHPGETQFGTTEEDLYDGELAFTDKHIGRLLEELYRLPGGADRTIIILTSDHGDGFGEHGFINHGQALYRELLHVPLIVRVPNIEPRNVPGPVSPLDIVPTLVDLCGLRVPQGASFEGESLVPQLFYGKDARSRIVFAETNYPKPIRAAVSDTHKLVFDLKNNLYELYDLKKDPWEKTNLWKKDTKAFETMKGYMDDWLERVYYSRDSEGNQAMDTLGKYLLTKRPSPKVAIADAHYDGDRIAVLGVDTDKDSYKGGDKAIVTVYYQVLQRPESDVQFQAVLWPLFDKGVDDKPTKNAQSTMRQPAKGLLPTTRWRKGEFIADEYKIRLPPNWGKLGSGKLALGLRARTVGGRKNLPSTGKSAPQDPDALWLTEVGFEGSAEQPPSPQPQVPPGKTSP